MWDKQSLRKTEVNIYIELTEGKEEETGSSSVATERISKDILGGDVPEGRRLDRRTLRKRVSSV